MRILGVLTLLLGAGCFTPVTDADAGIPDSGVDAGNFWSWSGELVSVSFSQWDLAASLGMFRTSGWNVDLASRRFTYDYSIGMMRSVGQRDLSDDELARLEVAVHSMPLAAGLCNSEPRRSTMTVRTHPVSFNLGDSNHCSGTDLIILDFLPVTTVIDSY